MGMSGHCQCGTVQFTTTLDKPQRVYVCHCLECRFQSTSAYGLTAIFPVFDFSDEAKKHLKCWTRTTFEGKEKQCWFCERCGSRIYHYCDGQKVFTIKAGALDGLTKEMMDSAIHIWCKRAIVPIPDGAERWKEEPDEGTAND